MRSFKAIFLLFAFMLALHLVVLAQNDNAYVKHKVTKKETVFSVAKDNDITIDELVEANPQMNQEGFKWKKGIVINIPTKKQVVQQKVVAKPVRTTVNVGVMLPLHNVDNDGRRMIEYYRGMLMAVKKLKEQGINVNIHAWNMAIDSNVDEILKDAATTKLDMIFGPLYTSQVAPLTKYCESNNIKLVIPFSIKGNPTENHPNVYQVYQSDAEIYSSAITHFMKRFPIFHTVIIDCNDSTNTNKTYICDAFRKQVVEKGMKYYITNLKSPDTSFGNCFRANEQNIVMLTSSRSGDLTAALQKLTNFKATHPEYLITLFGFTDWFMFQKQHIQSFARFDTYIPSTYYYNSASRTTNELESFYRKNFNSDLMGYIPCFALTGYDQGMFFIGGLKKYDENFEGSMSQQYATPVQTIYNFKRDSQQSGYRNRYFQFVHYNKDGSIESVAY